MAQTELTSITSIGEETQIMRVLDAIQGIVNVTVSEFDIKKLAQQVVETITGIVNAEAASIFLLDEDKDPPLTMIAGTGYRCSLVDKATYEIGEGVTGTIATGKSIVAKKGGDHHVTHPEWKGKYDRQQWGDSGKGCYSFLGVPLKFKEKVVGVLKVENKKEEDKYIDFTLQDKRIVGILAFHISAVIENTKLYKKQQNIINTIVKTTEGIQRIPFDEVLQRIVEANSNLLKAKFCHLRLRKDDALEIRAITGVKEWTRTTAYVGEGITGKVVRTAQ